MFVRFSFLFLFFSPPPPCPQARRSWRCRAPPEPPGSPWLLWWPGCRYGHTTRAAPTAPSPPSTHGTGLVGTLGGSTGCAGSAPALRWELICAPCCRTGGGCFAQGELGTRSFMCRCMGWGQHLSKAWQKGRFPCESDSGESSPCPVAWRVPTPCGKGTVWCQTS